MTLTFEEKYYVSDDTFDTEEESTFWAAKNSLRTILIHKLQQITNNNLFLTFLFDGKEETSTNHLSNIKFHNPHPTFEYLTLPSFTFAYKVLFADASMQPKKLSFTSQQPLNLYISTNRLQQKLPPFDDNITLPKNIVATNDAFDSELSDTYWQGKNALFHTLNKHFEERNKQEPHLPNSPKIKKLDYDEKELQKYYKIHILGTPETDKNTLNTNINWNLEPHSSFDTLTIKNFSFKISVKIRNKMIYHNFDVTYSRSLNLIISVNKFTKKLQNKIPIK